MLRSVLKSCWLGPVFTAFALSFTGCANFVETRAITAFTEALQEQDTNKLRDKVSSNFEHKALRMDQSIDDFAVLRLPKGEVTITNVNDISETEKEVEAEIGERKERVKYKLVREAKTRTWVVDDIKIRQKKGNIVASRSVTELMDLITSVREFLKAWDGGEQRDMVALATPEFGTVLGSLPREYVANLAKQAIGDRAQESKIKPEAQIDEDVAVVRLPRKSGQMVISFRKSDGQWAIDDVAVESRGDKAHIPSVRQLAIALQSATQFLDAYNSVNKDRLQEVCKKGLYDGSLAAADLRAVKLPTSAEAMADYSIRLETGVADFVVNGEREVVKLSLVQLKGEDSQTATRYLVEEISIYDLAEKQEKRLSAMFVSSELVDEFSKALVTRDLEMLKVLASLDFRTKVWNRVDEATLLQLPMREIENSAPQLMTTVYNGPVTEITVKQGSRALVFKLVDRGGKMYIDDVLVPVVGRPNSLKTTLEVMISVTRFVNALGEEDLKGLQRTSSRDYNRLVWHVAQAMPQVGINPFEHFRHPLVQLDVEEKQAVVGLGDDRFGARFLMVKEGDQFVVDDVLLIAGPDAVQRVALKDSMKMELSRFRGNRAAQRQAEAGVE